MADLPARPAVTRRVREINAGFEASPFSRLAITHALSTAGDAFVTVALAGSLFFDISPHAARGRVALSLLLTMTPFAVVAPFLGPAIDKIKGGRRLMIVLSCIGRVVVCLAMGQVVHNLLLFPAAFGALVLSRTYAVAKSSLVPTVVDDEDRLVEANAKLALIGVLAGFVGSGPAIFFLKVVNAAWALRVGALVFVVAAASAVRLRQARPGAPPPPELARADLHEPAIVLAASTAMAVLRGGVGFLTFLIAFELKKSGAPSWWFGLVLAATLVGGTLGAVVAPRLRARVSEENMLAAALAAVALGALLATRLSVRPASALLAAVVGLAANAAKLSFDSLVQRDAPEAVQGRSFARFEASFQVAWVIGALLPVIITLPAQAGFVTLAIASLVALASYLSGRRVAKAHPHPPLSHSSQPIDGNLTRSAGQNGEESSVGDVDALEPEAGGVDLGGGGQLPG
ncbi:MAG: MFS transporter [Actinobacteria bacterium]|nr:MFS transporter [Actinomycetota bacterium]